MSSCISIVVGAPPPEADPMVIAAGVAPEVNPKVPGLYVVEVPLNLLIVEDPFQTIEERNLVLFGVDATTTVSPA